MKNVLQTLRGAFPVLGVAMAISFGITSRASGQADCNVNSVGSSIGPAICGANDLDNLAFVVDAANLSVPGACNLAPTLVCVFLPSPTTPDIGDVCADSGSTAASCMGAGGLAMPVPAGIILLPGQFVRFSAVDNPGLTNCVLASDTNCEYIVAGMNYTALHSDEIDNTWRASVCHRGTTVQNGFDNQSSNQTNVPAKHPDVDIEKSVAPGKICEGTSTQVTYTYTVQWGPMATLLSNLDNVVVTDTTCGPVIRGADTPGNNNLILEQGEVWNYSCTTSISTATTNTGTVNADDACTGLGVDDSDQATVTANPEPACEINGPSPVCPGATDLMYSAKEVSVPPLAGATFAWTISGATFCDGSTAATGETVCVDAPSTCDSSFQLDVTVTVGDCSSTCSRTVTVDDNTNPEATCPGPVTVSCDEDVPAANPALVTCTDNCPGGATASHVSDVPSGGTCPKTITRTYRCTDACGNTDDCTQIITVDDNTPPEATCPGPVTVSCDDDVPAANPALVTCTDNCDAGATASHVSDVPSGGTCPRTITRTYRCTDACGNTDDCTQIITVNDTTPPEATCPGPVTVSCDEDVPAANPALVTCTDNCPGGATASHVSDVPSGGTCPRTITRTYRCTDACGNTDDCTQIITVDDNTPPEATCPGPVTVACDDDVPASNPALVSCSDNCDAGATSSFVGDVDSGGTCPRTITRTYRCTDACNNIDDCTQIITVDDNTPPVITCPDVVDATDCKATPSFGPATATDACDDAVAITFTDATTGSCPDTQTCVTRTWTATDDCGNSSTCSRTICVPCCDEPGTCRVTGGGNDQYQGNKYTHGGQAGASDSVHGEWTHHQKSGPDHRFVFHAGTSSAPDETEVHIVTCSDPVNCHPARPAPFKQIDFEGVGTFKNIHGYNPPVGDAVAGNGGTFHWFEVHIEDLGEPGSNNPEPGADCPAGGSAGELADCGCPDFYSITIYRDYDPDTEPANMTDVIYHVHGYMNGGNHQIHPALD